MAAARSQWWRTPSEKHKDAEGNDDELLVFGYSCKLFKDDEKATYIELGNHLIPWMGDKSLMIDRFDARGHLHDLSQFEPKLGIGTESLLTKEEKTVEALCDDERYMALTKDLEEEELHHEEELKRLRTALSEDNAYKEVQFSYDAPVGEPEPEPEPIVDDDDKPFIAPDQLNIPPDMFTPRTIKENAIIEKTAAFISTHGTQMEIVLKTKQAGNSQFQFLSFDSPLNPYYKHVVLYIKEGKYKPVIENQDENDDEDDDDDDGNYLHPSLFAAKNNSTSQKNSLMLYYPYNIQNEETAYSQLVDKLKDKVMHCASNDNSQPNSQAHSPVTPQEQETDEMPITSSQSYVIPPEDMQQVIDKMAAYVAKNGESFEKTVLAKGDSRFDFLKSSHKYFSYYKQRCKHHLLEKRQPSKFYSEKKSKKSSKAPVSFAIKSKDGDGTTLEKNILGGDESENDANVIKSSDQCYDADGMSHTPENSFEESAAAAIAAPEITPQERLKDKIAAAARERMVQITKEKMLQLERKRKAMLFLNMLKSSGLSVDSNKKSVTSTIADSNCDASSLPTSAITSPLNSPSMSPLRNKGTKEKVDGSGPNAILSTFIATGSERRRHSRSRSKSRSSKHKSIRSKQSSSGHKYRSSSDKDRSSHSRSKKRSRRSRSRSRHRHSSHKSKSSKHRSKHRHSSSDSS